MSTSPEHESVVDISDLRQERLRSRIQDYLIAANTKLAYDVRLRVKGIFRSKTLILWKIAESDEYTFEEKGKEVSGRDILYIDQSGLLHVHPGNAKKDMFVPYSREQHGDLSEWVTEEYLNAIERRVGKYRPRRPRSK